MEKKTNRSFWSIFGVLFLFSTQPSTAILHQTAYYQVNLNPFFFPYLLAVDTEVLSDRDKHDHSPLHSKKKNG